MIFGVDSLAPDTLSRVRNANRQCEFTAWVAEQALHCRTCRLVLFPEDLGGHSSDGPASVWQTKEFMLLESLNEARRGGAFLCQLSEVDQRRPLGVLTNVPGLWPFLRLGWPSFSQSDNNLVYTGPLPRYCPCKKQHEVLKGTLSVDQFYTSRASTFGPLLWSRCFENIMDYCLIQALRVCVTCPVWFACFSTFGSSGCDIVSFLAVVQCLPRVLVQNVRQLVVW